MSTSVLKALPGKLDIKRHPSSILYVSIHDLCVFLTLFLSQMLSNFHSVEVELKHLRAFEFSGAKTLEKFPYSLSAEFKRRKTSKIGERTAMEFYSEIYV